MLRKSLHTSHKCQAWADAINNLLYAAWKERPDIAFSSNKGVWCGERVRD